MGFYSYHRVLFRMRDPIQYNKYVGFFQLQFRTASKGGGLWLDVIAFCWNETEPEIVGDRSFLSFHFKF